MPPIRPSSLSIARHCQLSPWLSERFPETNRNIERGNAVDREVSAALLPPWVPPQDPDAVACVDWIRRYVEVRAVQTRFALMSEGRDLFPPETGRPDVVGTDPWEPHTVLVVDIKKREQYDAARVPLPDENLQLHGYALAATQTYGLEKYRTALLLFGDGQVEAIWSKEYTSVQWAPWMREIEQICTHEVLDGDKPPIGKAGPHCTDCYPRLHCQHWALAALEGETALAPLSTPGVSLTPERAGQAYLAIKAMRELAERGEEILRAYRLHHGDGSVAIGDKVWGPTIVPGRKSADVAALEAAGLHQFVKKGRPFEQWRLTRRRS